MTTVAVESTGVYHLPLVEILDRSTSTSSLSIHGRAANAPGRPKTDVLMNVKLTVVISDITGATGMNIIKAIVRGLRDPVRLAEYRDVRCKASTAEIAAALQGNWREEHLFDLRQA